MLWIDQLRAADWSQAGWIALGTYLLGCLTVGYYLVRQRTRLDIRQLGSGSVGARNVGRILGWRGFWLTLVGDFAKGALAVWVASRITDDERLVALSMIAVVTGHIWPIQLRFHGGKGVATSLGAMVVYDPELALAFGAVFLGGLALCRRTVLSALLAFACLPWLSPLLGPEPGRIRALAVSVLAGLILLAHRRNLIEEFWRFVERHDLHLKHH